MVATAADHGTLSFLVLFRQILTFSVSSTMLVAPWFVVLLVHAVYSGVQIPIAERLKGTEMQESSAANNDLQIVKQAEAYFREEQLLQAARTLRTLQNPDAFLTQEHRKWLRSARVLEEAMKSLSQSPGETTDEELEEEWKKQGESHGDYETSIYYKVEESAKLTCRIETPIPRAMLVPILSVLNESSLYGTWIPTWNRPVRLGLSECQQLANDRRGHQILRVLCDVPWPLSPREGLMDVIAVDDIDATGSILAKMQSLGTHPDRDAHLIPKGFVVPPKDKNVERIDLDGAILFRACPKDHPNYLESREKHGEDDLILVQYTLSFDAKMPGVPQTVINFMTRVVIGVIWNKLLSIAEQVRDGKRPEHSRIIRDKADFYQWLDERCHRLLQQQQPPKESIKSSTRTGDGPWNLQVRPPSLKDLSQTESSITKKLVMTAR